MGLREDWEMLLGYKGKVNYSIPTLLLSSPKRKAVSNLVTTRINDARRELGPKIRKEVVTWLL